MKIRYAQRNDGKNNNYTKILGRLNLAYIYTENFLTLVSTSVLVSAK